MRKEQNFVTWKFRYECDQDLYDVIAQYNNVLRFTYNRVVDNPYLSAAELTDLQKEMHKADFIMSHLMNCAVKDAKAIYEKSGKGVVFGGKKLFKDRIEHKISKKIFRKKRLMPLYSIGTASSYGNRLFRIQSDKEILLQLNRNTHITLHLHGLSSKRRKELCKLMALQNEKKLPITYKLDLNYIYITFDYNHLHSCDYVVTKNRVMALDLNPNYIGYSIVNWNDSNNYTLITSGLYSLKPLNDYENSLSVRSDSKEAKAISKKRKEELTLIAEELFSICKNYQCEVFAVEKLSFKSGDRGFGKRFNRLCHAQWDRNFFVHQIQKRIKASSTTYVEILPQYSSFIGNLIYRQERLPDPCLASMEIGRRGLEFCNQYIFDRKPQKKIVVFPDIRAVRKQLTESLEEIGVDILALDSWVAVYYAVKKSKSSYRFSLAEALSNSANCVSRYFEKRYLQVYRFA